MIKYNESDSILDSAAEAIVIPVNTVGIMGKGLALAAKKRFPKNNTDYVNACWNGQVRPGRVFCTRNNKGLPKYIINFPTKQHWRNPSRIEWIEEGLKDLRSTIPYLEIQSIAIPALGCGLGGLNWNDVEPLIISTFEDMPNITVIIYPPKD